MSKPISGTLEWSVASHNIYRGCAHRCTYCYARGNALRFKRIKTPDEWPTMVLNEKALRKRWRKVNGRIMFPTTHDITPDTLAPCLGAIAAILEPGNDILIVSKPHVACIQAICERFRDKKDQILFRFTIGALSDDILAYWEPGAPDFAERLASLKHAHAAGFETSVSAEPLLEPERARELFDTLAPFVTHSIWFGKMNQIKRRVLPGTDPAEIARIEAGQTEAAVRAIYESLRNEPKAYWKESYKAVCGLELAEAAGLDR